MAIDETQIGIVKEIKGHEITVIMNPQGGCSSCGMHGLCGAGSNSDCIEHHIESDIELEVGDKVILYIDPSKRIISALLLFIFPITLLVVMYYIASMIFDKEIYAVISGLTGLVIAFIINRIIDKLWGKKVRYIIASKYEEDYDENHS
jgi:positive regulator of sigma E activity